MKNQKCVSKRSKRKKKINSEHCNESQNKGGKISNIENQALISENDANKKQKNKSRSKATSLHKIAKFKNLLFKEDLLSLSKISILMNILDADNIFLIIFLIIKTLFHSILKKNKRSFKRHSQEKNEISETSARKRKRCNVLIETLKKQWSQIMKKDWSIQFKWMKNRELMQIANINKAEYALRNSSMSFDYWRHQKTSYAFDYRRRLRRSFYYLLLEKKSDFDDSVIIKERQVALCLNLEQILKILKMSDAYIIKGVRQRASVMFEKRRNATGKFCKAIDFESSKKLSQAEIDTICLQTYDEKKSDRQFLASKSTKFGKVSRLSTEREQTISLHMAAIKERQTTRDYDLYLTNYEAALCVKEKEMKKTLEAFRLRMKEITQKAEQRILEAHQLRTTTNEIREISSEGQSQFRTTTDEISDENSEGQSQFGEGIRVKKEDNEFDSQSQSLFISEESIDLNLIDQ